MEKHALKNLADLSSSELEAFLDSFDNVLCDCDGVLWSIKSHIVDAHKGISKLKAIGKRVGAVTNNCTRTLSEYGKYFQKRNFNIDKEDIVYPTLAIIHFLQAIGFDKEIYLIGTLAMKNELLGAGFKIADQGETVGIEESLQGIHKHLNDNENIGAVVFDLDFNLSYMKLAKAAVYLHRQDVLFIIGASDVGARFENHPPLFGPGLIQQTIQEFTGRQGLNLGKPGKKFSEFVNAKFNIKEPSRTLFVGDSLSVDIQFANMYGYQSLFVLTGQCTLEEAKNCSGNMVPDFYMNSIADIHDLITKKLNM